jgi:hypothetical protein
MNQNKTALRACETAANEAKAAWSCQIARLLLVPLLPVKPVEDELSVSEHDTNWPGLLVCFFLV